ncbi:MAG: DUF2162 family putative transporter [Candidatus Hydrogenedentota bacterium]
MIRPFWIAGILFTLSIFGIKVGLGAAGICYNKNLSLRRKSLFLSGIFTIYLLLFGGLYILVAHFQLLNYLDRFLEALRYGMLIHLLIASGLILWGVRLLLPPQGSNICDYRGSFLLIFPCPVCATAILLTLSFGYSLFSISLSATTGILLGVFLGISLLTLLTTIPFRRKIIDSTGSFIGITMLIVAAYFLLTIIIAPIYQETLDVYNLASRNAEGGTQDSMSLLAILATVTILFGIGFFRNLLKTKE